MSMEEIRRIDTLPSQARVEVEATRREAASPKNFIEREGHLLDTIRELVCIPAVLRIPAIRVEAPENSVRHCSCDFVLEALPRQRRMIHFNIDAVLICQIVFLKERVDGGDIGIVLVLRRLVRFRLDQECPLKSDFVFMLRD